MERQGSKNLYVPLSLRIASDPVNLNPEFCILLTPKHLNCSSFICRYCQKRDKLLSQIFLLESELCSEALVLEVLLSFLKGELTLGLSGEDPRQQQWSVGSKEPALRASSCSGSGHVACRRRVQSIPAPVFCNLPFRHRCWEEDHFCWALHYRHHKWLVMETFIHSLITSFNPSTIEKNI